MNREEAQEKDPGRSIIGELRAVVPSRELTFAEALRIAELQAAKLRQLTHASDRLLTEDLIAELPRVEVRYRRLPTSGMSYWNGQTWIIGINSGEPLTRQRFTLLHEFKHIVDHGRTSYLYGARGARAEERAEQASDYFAGCVLMPKPLMKRAWGAGIQRPSALAAHFDVSPRAATVRLAQLGLSEPVKRCTASPTGRFSGRSPRAYYRQLSRSWLAGRRVGVAA